jgi:ABC-type multidrug transport system fused ATPase/permease subunit
MDLREVLLIQILAAYLAPIFAPILSFMTYSLLAQSEGGKGNLDTNRMFTSLSLFALLQDPLASFVTALSSFMGSVGSFVRIQAFLNSEPRADDRMIQDQGTISSSLASKSSTSEQEKGCVSPSIEPKMLVNDPLKGTLDGNSFVIKDASFGYDKNEKPVLSNIDAVVPSGKLTLVVGPVGSGKSTFLKAILGEVGIMEGSVHVSNPDIAFCDQTPWHMNGTVRDSIIAFSHPDERWYQKVLEVCALKQDLAQLPKGDLSTIGSKGIVLSGGQSQRVSLARAVYAQRPTIILDDVFSGLDAHTENAVFHNLVGTHGILRDLNTTVIITSSRCTYNSS